MDDRDSLIAEQALKIRELEARVMDAEQRLKDISAEMTCIGGPLNDNKHGYTKAQKAIFFRIQGFTE